MKDLSKRSFLKLLALSPTISLLPFTGLSKAEEKKTIKLIYSHVAGAAYYDMAGELETIKPYEPLRLVRESSNRYDRRAIEIYRLNGKKLGYVKRIRNTALANLMDAGVTLTAYVAEFDLNQRYVDLPYVVEMTIQR